MRFVDSHVHLSHYDGPESVAGFARLTDTLLSAVSIDRNTSIETLSMVKRWPHEVLGFVGVHPSEAGRSPGLEWLPAALEESHGLGEVGLDPGYGPGSPVATQDVVFQRQLALVEGSGKPIQVHSRGAVRRSLDAVESFTLGPVLFHWFEGEELLSEVMDRGIFVSLGPALLRSRKLERIARACDRGLLLTETDGPVTYRQLGGAQGPCLVPSVVFRLAEVLGEGFEETRQMVAENAARYLGPKKG
ncbi:MAG: TatD family hydrolase [Thaumarchaeota archaeon]|nr:TatD family hydrolase [Nitrososphaerota archaeon]